MDPLSTLIEWISLYGAFGLLALGIFERFVPVLPSYGVLVAIGIAANQSVWSVSTAVLASVSGSLLGSLALYWLTLHLSEERVHRMLLWVGRMTGISAPRIETAIVLFRRHQRRLSFGMQLVPSIRLISPIIAGMFRADANAFAIATLLGILAWNSLFIGVGYVASTVTLETNASTLALQVVVLLLVIELGLALLWRWYHLKSGSKQ
jgi:membrane protein DedA with SNARE-associated domain